MVEAGLGVGVADGMVQTGRGFGRHAMPNDRGDHLGQVLRAGEKIGPDAAATQLGRPAEPAPTPRGHDLAGRAGHWAPRRRRGGRTAALLSARPASVRSTPGQQVSTASSRSRRSAASSWFSSSTWSGRGSRITDKRTWSSGVELTTQLRQPGRRADETVAQHRVDRGGGAAIAVQGVGHAQPRGREQPCVVDQIRHQHGGRIGHQRLSQSPKRSTGSVAAAQSSASSAVRRLLRRDTKTNPPATAPRTTSAFHFTAPP